MSGKAKEYRVNKYGKDDYECQEDDLYPGFLQGTKEDLLTAARTITKYFKQEAAKKASKRSKKK